MSLMKLPTNGMRSTYCERRLTRESINAIPMIDPIPQKMPPSKLLAIISPFDSLEDRSNGWTGGVAGLGSLLFVNFFAITHTSVP